MSCESFDTLVVDVCREGKDQPAFRDAALAHAASCAACGSVLAAQRDLTRGLHALAEETAGAETPAAVRGTLLAAFQHRAEARRRTTAGAPRVWAWLAAAAVLLVAGTLLWGPSEDQSPERPLVAQAVHPAPVSTPSPEPRPAEASRATDGSSRETPLPAVATPEARTRRPRERPSAPTQAIFVPLVPNDSLADLGQGWVVRVGLTRAALASWGWSLDGEVGAETVEAELLVGEDGVARAIRVEQ